MKIWLTWGGGRQGSDWLQTSQLYIHSSKRQANNIYEVFFFFFIYEVLMAKKIEKIIVYQNYYIQQY